MAEPAPAAPAAEPAPAIATGHPDLDKADRLAATGQDHARAGRHEKALTSLLKAKGLYESRMAQLEDYEKYVDALAWIAASFVSTMAPRGPPRG